MYIDLLPQEQKKVDKVAYVLDRYNISREEYHGLTQAASSFSRTHYIEGCQQVLGQQFEIAETPGNAHRAQVSLIEMLKRETINTFVGGNELNVRNI